MATLQILVLSFQVRVLVGQHRKRKFHSGNFRFLRFSSCNCAVRFRRGADAALRRGTRNGLKIVSAFLGKAMGRSGRFSLAPDRRSTLADVRCGQNEPVAERREGLRNRSFGRPFFGEGRFRVFMRRREIRTACFLEGGAGLPMEEADSGMRPAAEHTVGFGHRRRNVRAETFGNRRKNGVVRSVVVLSDGFVGIGRRSSGKNACRSGLRGGSIDRFFVSRKRAASGSRENGPVGRRSGRSSGKSDAVGVASGVGDGPHGGSVLGGRPVGCRHGQPSGK